MLWSIFGRAGRTDRLEFPSQAFDVRRAALRVVEGQCLLPCGPSQLRLTRYGVDAAATMKATASPAPPPPRAPEAPAQRKKKKKPTKRYNCGTDDGNYGRRSPGPTLPARITSVVSGGLPETRR